MSESTKKAIELQQAITQAESKIIELRKELDVETKRERTLAIAQVRELIKANDLTAVDLGFTRKELVKRVGGAAGDKRNTVAAKYREPASGKTWTGRGKSPSWMTEQIAAGHKKEDFLIPAETAAAVAADVAAENAPAN